MPTENYVKKQFDDGMAVERWFEELLRKLKDVKVVKRRDVSEQPHKHEDIKDIPSSPDFEVFLDSRQRVLIWLTHKKMQRQRWLSSREARWLPEMFWRFKTFRSMEEGHYLAYCIFDSRDDFGIGEMQVGANIIKSKFVKSSPFEVLWMRYDKDSYRGTWSDSNLADQDDLRARVDMSSARIIYRDGKLLIAKLAEVL